jgi:mannose-6-phosphate isomerase-like protein (cupin superfamily)
MATVKRADELPQLTSTRDTRDRIDLVTEELFGVDTLRADRILYHPGDTAAAHYHRDCEHWFFVLRGNGILHTDTGEHDLGPGDVVRLEANEVHWFSNPTEDEFEFIELWVPAPSDTVWIKDGDVCTWAPADDGADASA